MGKFQFLTELPALNMSDFLFLDDSLSKYQCIFTKLGMCIEWKVHCVTTQSRLQCKLTKLTPIRGRVHFLVGPFVINSSVIYKLRNFNKAKLVAKHRKRENC